MCLLLSIDEFGIDNSFNFKTDNVKTNNLEHTKAIIPNENTIITTKSLKSSKYNYISTINPKIITKINGTITNLNNQSIVSSADSRLIMDFLIKPCL